MAIATFLQGSTLGGTLSTILRVASPRSPSCGVDTFDIKKSLFMVILNSVQTKQVCKTIWDHNKLYFLFRTNARIFNFQERFSQRFQISFISHGKAHSCRRHLVLSYMPSTYGIYISCSVKFKFDINII